MERKCVLYSTVSGKALSKICEKRSVDNLAEVTVAVDVFVDVSVKVRVELWRRRKERQTYPDQLPTQSRTVPVQRAIITRKFRANDCFCLYNFKVTLLHCDSQTADSGRTRVFIF